jgi:hypothetical protein
MALRWLTFWSQKRLFFFWNMHNVVPMEFKSQEINEEEAKCTQNNQQPYALKSENFRLPDNPPSIFPL